ncbi:hypothetical protein [Acaryochloris marina]|uniref:Uncharacterized protein n=1 Tax=Acaryochloris marina (strain MBIC 11017) TaxID=329726 RepID=A8ZPQ9_ACAM1|nr:hypothetical protein [Acaryochloris marina]ABW33068.1 hypothetical protein AM1_F0116 [Acaryochloris marina MBIC11017]
MPSASIDKLNQLKRQLQDCINPTAAKLLKSTIAKLEAQLNIGQDQIEVSKIDQIKTTNTNSSKIAQRKAAHKKSERKSRQKASQKQRTTLKPPSLNKIEPKPEVISQSKNLPNPAQEKLHVKTVDTPNRKNSNSKDQKQAKTTSKSKSGELSEKPPLLPGNGTHRAWCRIPGIIRVREKEFEAGRTKSLYFVEVDGQPIKLFLSKKSFKKVKSVLDKPVLVFGYPNIMNGQITSLQLTGTSQRASAKTENWVLIGVWRADKQRVLIQRDQERDPEIHIRQHSPLVSEDCLEKLKDGKLYEFICHRDGVTVKVVAVGERSTPKSNATESTDQEITDPEIKDQDIIDQVLSKLESSTLQV